MYVILAKEKNLGSDEYDPLRTALLANALEAKEEIRYFNEELFNFENNQTGNKGKGDTSVVTRITFLGHGGIERYGMDSTKDDNSGEPPEEFVERLLKANLPESVTTIDLLGCNIGLRPRPDQLSYAERVAELLDKKGKNIKVNAITYLDNQEQHKYMIVTLSSLSDGKILRGLGDSQTAIIHNLNSYSDLTEEVRKQYNLKELGIMRDIRKILDDKPKYHVSDTYKNIGLLRPPSEFLGSVSDESEKQPVQSSKEENMLTRGEIKRKALANSQSTKEVLAVQSNVDKLTIGDLITIAEKSLAHTAEVLSSEPASRRMLSAKGISDTYLLQICSPGPDYAKVVFQNDKVVSKMSAFELATLAKKNIEFAKIVFGNEVAVKKLKPLNLQHIARSSPEHSKLVQDHNRPRSALKPAHLKLTGAEDKDFEDTDSPINQKRKKPEPEPKESDKPKEPEQKKQKNEMGQSPRPTPYGNLGKTPRLTRNN